MAKDDSKKSNDDKEEVQRRLKEIEEKSKNKQKKDNVSVAQQLATRSKLERDYDEDRIYVSFKSSPETERTVISRRPNNKEYIEILTLGISASKYGASSGDDDKLVKILNRFAGIAADLTVDKSLDEEFWNEYISSIALQNFINALIEKSQSFGGPSEEEINSFRKK